MVTMGVFPFQGKTQMVKPGIEPGTSCLVVRSSDHEAKRLVRGPELATQKTQLPGAATNCSRRSSYDRVSSCLHFRSGKLCSFQAISCPLNLYALHRSYRLYCLTLRACQQPNNNGHPLLPLLTRCQTFQQFSPYVRSKSFSTQKGNLLKSPLNPS